MQYLEELIFESWWLAAFLLIFYAVYDIAIEKVEATFDALNQKKMNLMLQKEEALTLQKKLKREIASHQDFHWMELVLKEKLGVCENGETKIFFTPTGESE